MSGAERVLRGGTIAAVVGLGVFGFVSHRLLTGGVAWLSLLFFVFSGWGYLVVRVARISDVDFGLRALWGVAAFLTVAGIPVAAGVCSRPVLLALGSVGIVAFAWRELVVETPIWRSIRGAGAWMRANPALAVLAVVLVAFTAVQLVGAVAKLDPNAWDDDVAYTPLVRRLLDAGNLVEPFSFRRLAALGGQSVLQGLGAARGVLSSMFLIDHGVGFGLTLLLVIGHARRLGRVPALWLATLLLLLLLLPDLSINTASYWTGAAMFLGLYRTITLADASPRSHFVIAAIVGAATCTLRQNYLPVVALFLVLALLSRLRTTSWRDERRTWLLVIAAAAAALLPWCIAAFVSSRTFLFPLMDGTWNHALTLQQRGASWADQIAFVVSACVDSKPLAIVPILFIVAAATTDRRLARPLTALFVASTLGFLLLAWSFGDADTFSLWRYAFGFDIALTCVLALEVCNEDDAGPARLPALGRWVLFAALVLQLGFVRTGTMKRLGEMLHDINQAAVEDRHGDPAARAERRRYAAMQADVPAGARLAVMVDDPAYLDFARNEIANLDIPGYASPDPQMPMFCGPDALRRYFLDQGLRYVAFVRPMASRYFYRRDAWTPRLFKDSELFEVMAAYVIDAIDSFTALAGIVKVLHDQDGLVVLDLATGPPVGAARCEPDEARRRDAFVRAFATKEGFPDAWLLSPHRDVVYCDGVSYVTFIDDADPKWFEFEAPDPGFGSGRPVRWMNRRVHLRVRGDRTMHLRMRGRIRINSLYARPRLDVTVAGTPVASVVADEHGLFAIDADVPASLLDGWSDLYVVFNTIGTPEKDVADLRIAELREVTWEPRGR